MAGPRAGLAGWAGWAGGRIMAGAGVMGEGRAVRLAGTTAWVDALQQYECRIVCSNNSIRYKQGVKRQQYLFLIFSDVWLSISVNIC